MTYQSTSEIPTIKEHVLTEPILSELREIRGEMRAVRSDVASVKQLAIDHGRRLDTLNGSVARHEREINKIKLEQAQEKGAREAREDSLISKRSVVSFNLLMDGLKGVLLIGAIILAVNHVG